MTEKEKPEYHNKTVGLFINKDADSTESIISFVWCPESDEVGLAVNNGTAIYVPIKWLLERMKIENLLVELKKK